MRYTISRMQVLVARRGFLRLVAKGRPSESNEKEPISAHPVAALIPKGQGGEHNNSQHTRRTWDKDELRPSQSRMSRRLRMGLTKMAILCCFVLALVCALSVPLLSSFKVRHINVEGAVRYAAEDIVSLCGVNVGDELLAHDVDGIAARVKSAYPYLRGVSVRRELGGFVIVLAESQPRWGLLLSDGRIALIDGDGYIGEVCDQSLVPEGVCLLRMELPALPPETEDGEPQVQTPTPGKYIQGSSRVLMLHAKLSEALDEITLHAAPAALDLSDIYAVTLTLEDGTQISLHECSDALRQLEHAKAALDSYFLTHPAIGDAHTLVVDVDDYMRVSIRRVPKTVPDQTENAQKTEN